jgi:hypothetical protein
VQPFIRGTAAHSPVSSNTPKVKMLQGDARMMTVVARNPEGTFASGQINEEDDRQ